MEFTQNEINNNRQRIKHTLIENFALHDLDDAKLSTVLKILQKWNSDHSGDLDIEIEDNSIFLYRSFYETDEEVVKRLFQIRERGRNYDIAMLKRLMKKYPEITLESDQ